MKKPIFYLVLMAVVGLVSCDPETPEAENEEEIITDVTLTFTPVGEGVVVTAKAVDEDGDGPLGLEIESDAVLAANTEYELSISFFNSVANEDITEEVEGEGAEHMIFFEFTTDIFTSPAGNGNADNRADAVNYNDTDTAGQPIGLSTQWTTGDATTGTLRIALKHQPDIKTATSTINDGETDVDITFPVTIN